MLSLLLTSLASVSAQTDIWLADGCFWEAQFAYFQVESDSKGPFKRANGTISSRTGYAGSVQTADDHLVCYHHGGGDQNDDYATLGYTEAVVVSLDAGKVTQPLPSPHVAALLPSPYPLGAIPAAAVSLPRRHGSDPQEREQFAALLKGYFGAFSDSQDGWVRPDPGDEGSPYRSAIGIPGGVDGDLYKLIVQANEDNTKRGQYNNTMKLVPDTKGSSDDEFNQVWIYDIAKFPFHRAEQYHQFHSNFQGPAYPDSYINDLWNLMIKLGKIDPTGCPEGQHF
eukprot:gene5221-935_t